MSRNPRNSDDLMSRIIDLENRLSAMERVDREETEIYVEESDQTIVGESRKDSEGNTVFASSRNYPGLIYPNQHLSWQFIAQGGDTISSGESIDVQIYDENDPSWGETFQYIHGSLPTTGTLSFRKALACKIGLGDEGANASRNAIASMNLQATHNAGIDITTIMGYLDLYKPALEFIYLEMRVIIVGNTITVNPPKFTIIGSDPMLNVGTLGWVHTED